MTKPPLPLGYAHRVDKETGYDYYINMVTGRSQWTLPRVSAYVNSNVDMNIGMVDPDTVLPPHGYYDYSQQTAVERSRYSHATSSDSSESYQALTGILAGGLAAFGLHMFMDDNEHEGKEEQAGHKDSAVWYEEY
ncbi:hypothetical protein EV183_001570 [Coemansia sp. RSA 2336]|nr:hypothetical protein EV183_001570 [Coemansia sp. RSA 2336]